MIARAWVGRDEGVGGSGGGCIGGMSWVVGFFLGRCDGGICGCVGK